MKMTKEIIRAYIVESKSNKSNQEIENDFKLLLKQKSIDIDDYSTAMELIYDE